MTNEARPITKPFPMPSALIVGALDDLRLAAERPGADVLEEIGIAVWRPLWLS